MCSANHTAEQTGDGDKGYDGKNVGKGVFIMPSKAFHLRMEDLRNFFFVYPSIMVISSYLDTRTHNKPGHLPAWMIMMTLLHCCCFCVMCGYFLSGVLKEPEF